MIVWLLLASSPAPQKTIQPPFAVKNEELAKLQLDEDLDGLKDWEEAISRTDPDNPDTDGDGTPDGQELKQGRDPLVKGPGDLRATSTAPQIGSSVVLPENFTQLVAQRFGERFILPLLSNPDAKPDPKAIAQELSREVLLASREPPQNLLANKDLSISSDNSNRAIKTFVETTNALLLSTTQQMSKPAVIIFSEALQGEDFSKLEALDDYLSTFDRTFAALKKVSVPSQLALLQLEYLNIAVREQKAIIQMRGAEKDLIGALIGAQDFAATADAYKAVLIKFDKEFKKRGIVF